MTVVGDWRAKAILGRFGKLRGRSMAELRERAGQAIAAELEARKMSSAVGEPRAADIWHKLDTSFLSGAASSDELRAHFAHRSSPAFFAGIRDGSSAATLCTPRWANELRQLIADADRILDGRFDLLGYKNLSFGTPIDWHFDPVNNRRAPRSPHWSRIPYLNAEIVGDHKVIWEINRHQHFFVLGRAYQATGRPEYAECFVQHITAWMDANPPKNGVNWASSLEVSYRAISWIWAIELFRNASVLTANVLQRMLAYLEVHGRHLERYLSTYFSPNTHLTGEALGLYYLGTVLPEFRRARSWRTLAWSIFERELPKQVYADGVYFEQATYYHRYTVDIFLHALLLARSNGVAVSSQFEERLSAAVSHLADLMRGNGTIPVIGDDDGGRLVQLEKQSFTDVRSALSVASVVLQQPEFAVVAGGATEEVLWLLGPDGVATVDTLQLSRAPQHTSALFSVGGYAIMRDDWSATGNHTVIDCGPLGATNCGHAHSDSLAVEIAVHGCALLVDPGAFTYTGSPAHRDKFRHSASHNTVTVDGESSAVSAGPFSWRLRTDAKVEQWWAGAVVDRFVGSHAGFERLPDPAIHRREVMYVRGEYWAIYDSILALESHEAIAHFHFAAGSTVSSLSPGNYIIEQPCGPDLQQTLFVVVGDQTTVEWGEDWVSPVYGSKVLAPYARATSRGRGRRDIVTLLVPTNGDVVTVSERPARSGRVVSVDRPGVQDILIFGAADSVVDGVAVKGESAFVRRRENIVEAVALFGSDSELLANGVKFSAATAAEARSDGLTWNVRGDGHVSQTKTAW